MPDHIKPRKAGDPFQIAAAEFNAIAAATNAYHGQQASGATDPGARQTADVIALEAYVKNTDDTEDLQRGHILGLDEPIYKGSDNAAELVHRFSYNGRVPQRPDDAEPENPANDWGNWAIALENIPSGKVGRCALAGIVAIDNLYLESKYHYYADIRPGNASDQQPDYDHGSAKTYQLYSNYHGAARILYAEDRENAPKDTYAILQLGGGYHAPLIDFVLAEDIDPDGGGKALVWHAGAETNPESYARVWLDWMHGDEGTTTNKKGMAVFIPDTGRLRIAFIEC